jgi:hypothetical protein
MTANKYTLEKYISTIHFETINYSPIPIIEKESILEDIVIQGLLKMMPSLLEEYYTLKSDLLYANVETFYSSLKIKFLNDTSNVLPSYNLFIENILPILVIQLNLVLVNINSENNYSLWILKL